MRSWDLFLGKLGNGFQTYFQNEFTCNPELIWQIIVLANLAKFKIAIITIVMIYKRYF